MNSLIVIPARGGSKGIPRKNIKEFAGKPLICHTIDQARSITNDTHICVTTDDNEIIETVSQYGLEIPFKRPEYLATDNAGTYEVLLHALDFYEKQGKKFDSIILLQCTSPFRKVSDIQKALNLYNKNLDMVVSVTESASNPYYNVFEENENGFLNHSKGNGEFHRRQDVPKTWEYNGAIYIINPESLKKMPISKFKKIKKYEMERLNSMDLDTPLDWKLAELVLEEGLIKI